MHVLGFFIKNSWCLETKIKSQQDMLNHVFASNFSQSRRTLHCSLIKGPSSATNSNYDSMTLLEKYQSSLRKC